MVLRSVPQQARYPGSGLDEERSDVSQVLSSGVKGATIALLPSRRCSVSLWAPRSTRRRLSRCDR